MDAVIPTYNSEYDLRGLFVCEPLLAAFDRLIVVDNGSHDASVELALAAGAEVVALSGNRGFGAAANAGAKLARGPAFALLNPDIRFAAPSVLTDLAANFEDTSVGIAIPALRLPDGRLQDSVRNIPTPVDLLLRRLIVGQAERGVIRADARCDVPWAVGAFGMFRRAAFDAVGGFNESYRLYFEDVDLCVRIRNAGWRVRFDPGCEVIHHHRGESRTRAVNWALRQHIRSAVRFYAANPAYLVPGSHSPTER